MPTTSISNEEKDERFLRAISLRDAGKYEEALEMFKDWEREAVEPDEKLAYLAAALTCLSWMRRYSDALDLIEYGRSLRAESERMIVDFETEAASIYSYVGQSDRSVEIYLGLLKDFSSVLGQPENHWFRNDIRLRCAAALLQTKQSHAARDILRDLLADDVDDVEQRARGELYLGLCDYVDGDLNSATAMIENCLPKLHQLRFIVEARFYLGGCYMKAGQHSRALAEFRFCYDHNDGVVPQALVSEMLSEAERQSTRKPV